MQWTVYYSVGKEGNDTVLGEVKPHYIEENIAQGARRPLPAIIVEHIMLGVRLR